MRRQYVLAAVGAVVLVAVFFLLLLKPKLSQISDARKDVQAEQDKRQSLELRLRQLQSAEKTAPDTMAKLDRLNVLLPQTPDLPALIRQLQDAATSSGIDLRSIAPSPPANLVSATGVSTITANLQVIGGFFRLESFLTRLENLQRVVEVTSISIAPSTDETTGLSTLSSTISMRLYVVAPGARLTGAAGASGGSSSGATPIPSPTARAT